MPVPTRDAKSLERDHRSAGEHLKNSTKEFHRIQPLSQLHQAHLKGVYGNAHHMEVEPLYEDVETCTHLQGCNLTGMIEMWWDGSYD